MRSLGRGSTAHDPLATDPTNALRPPSWRCPCGTDRLGATSAPASSMQRVWTCSSPRAQWRLPSRSGAYSVAWLVFRRVGRSPSHVGRRYDHGVSPFRAGDGHRGGARQQRRKHHLRDAIVNSLLCPHGAGRNQSAPRGGFRRSRTGQRKRPFRILAYHLFPTTFRSWRCK